MPLHQYEASLLAVHSSFPAYKFDDVDILTSHRVLELLFNWLAGETEFEFDFHLFLVGRTMIIENRSVRFGGADNSRLKPQLDHVVHPDRARPMWDKNRRPTFTTFPDSAREDTRGHFRVLRYNIGPLNCVVRCHVEAALEPTQQEHTGVDESPATHSKSTRSCVKCEVISERLRKMFGALRAFISKASPQSAEVAPRGGPSTTIPKPISAPDYVLGHNHPYPKYYLPPSVEKSPGGRKVKVAGATGASIAALKGTGLQGRTAGLLQQRSDALPGEQPSPQDRGSDDVVSNRTENADHDNSRLSETTTIDNHPSQRQVVAVLTENASKMEELTIQPNMAAHYFSRASHLEHIGYIKDGRVESVASRDLFRVLKSWERQEKTQRALRKLTSLLCHLYECCSGRKTNSGDLEPIILRLHRRDPGGVIELRVVSPPRGFLSPALPEHIVKMMWTEAVLGSD